MSTRNDRFNASMRSLDELTASFKDPSKAEVFPDKGLGVERMLDEIDHTLGKRASCPLPQCSEQLPPQQRARRPLPQCPLPLCETP